MGRIKTILLIFTFCSVCGCGGGAGPDNRPERVPVSGVVKVEGKTIAGAMVTFRSVSGGPGATGKTDASGRFVLSTYGSGDGAVPGKYKIGVTKYEIDEEDDGVDTDDENYEPPAYDELEEDDDEDEEPRPRRRGEGPKNSVPDAFADPEESGLTADITEATDSLELNLE